MADGVVSTFTVLWLTLSAFGAGSMVIGVTNIRRHLSVSEDFAFSIALGCSALGWLAFFPAIAGQLEPTPLLLITAATFPGLIMLARRLKEGRIPSFVPWQKTACAILSVLLVFDILGALPPVADADTLAYHMTIPKMFLEAGSLFFIPRAVDGASPLLQQMGYVLALGLGGEGAVRAWFLITGWSLAGVFFVICRRWTGATLSAYATIVLMGAPIITYALNSGQVEPRTATLALIAGFFTVEAVRQRDIGFAVAAGIACGFFAGSKYTGLLMVFASGLTLLLFTRHVKLCAAFSAAAIFVGCQWYAFNFYHSGDPIFPVLWGIVEYTQPGQWSDAQAHMFRNIWPTTELTLDKTLWNFLRYPFLTILAPNPIWEATRTGLGPFLLLILPGGLVGLFCLPDREVRQAVFIMFFIALVFYFVWFFFGMSQRIRHLLPVYPLVLVCAVVASKAAISRFAGLLPVMTVSIACTIAIQGAADIVYSVKSIRYISAGMQRDNYFENNISGYPMLQWLNDNLGPDDRVFLILRQWLYYLDVPFFYGHPMLQNYIHIDESRTTPSTLIRQFREQKITYIVRTTDLATVLAEDPLTRNLKPLYTIGCLSLAHAVDGKAISSRSLAAGTGGRRAVYYAYKLQPVGCPY